jgi:uncharacterized HAD superfamily protein
LDIDNVIARTDEVLRQVIRECSKDHVDLAYEDVVCFDYWLCRDSRGRRFDKAEWKGIHRKFVLNDLMRIPPVENVQFHLAQLGRYFEIHLATSRPEEGKEDTLRWLGKHHVPYDDLHFARDGEKHLIPVGFDTAVDDDREQGYAFFAKGIRVLLLAHPWNEVGPHSPLGRVAGWDELTRELLREQAR